MSSDAVSVEDEEVTVIPQMQRAPAVGSHHFLMSHENPIGVLHGTSVDSDEIEMLAGPVSKIREYCLRLFF